MKTSKFAFEINWPLLDNGQNEAAFILEDTVAIKYLVEPSIDSILLSIEPQKISE